MIISPIIFTDHPDYYAALLAALGGVAITQSPDWSEYELSAGRVGIHAASQDRPAGSVRLVVEMDRVLEWAARMDASTSRQGHGLEAEVAAADGTVLVACEISPAQSPAQGSVRVCPVWFTPEPACVSALLVKAGLSDVSDPSASDARRYAGSQGLIEVSSGEHPRTVLGFEYRGDLQELVPALRTAGAESQELNEGDSRSLLLANPDGGEPWKLTQATNADDK